MTFWQRAPRTNWMQWQGKSTAGTAYRLMRSLAICPKRMPRVNWPNKYPNWACRSIFSSSEALWAETRGRGVRVLALCPGATETGFFDAVGSEEMGTGQKLSTPEKVVRAGFRGIDQGRSYIIDGRNNYLMAQMVRFLAGAG